jgi:aldehyde dehydrogenase (NAD+)
VSDLVRLAATDNAFHLYERAKRAADRIEAGRVIINGAPHEPLAPFGGFKQSGCGREFGVFGLEAFLEPRAVIS